MPSSLLYSPLMLNGAFLAFEMPERAQRSATVEPLRISKLSEAYRGDQKKKRAQMVAFSSIR